MRTKKSLQIFALLIFMLGLYTFSSHRYDNFPGEDYPVSPTRVFSIAICSDSEGHDYDMYSQGFIDALNDYSQGTPYGFIYETFFQSQNDPYGLSMDRFLKNNRDLIFSLGSKSLTQGLSKKRDLPLVFANCMDISPLEGKEGVTGISSLPDLDFTLSLLLEVTEDIEAVGLIYQSGDELSLYQNTIIEDYLTQAHIPWKEYEIPSGTEVPEAAEVPVTEGDVPPDASPVAESKVSYNWNDNPNRIEGLAFTSASTPEEIASAAATECSALFIPSNNLLEDKLDIISQIAIQNHTVTVGGDSTTGRKTFVSVYTDMYDQGYRAGRLAFRILVDRESPEDYPVEEFSTKVSSKLYQDEIAMYFEKDFPKTFTEIDEFFANYSPGMLTTRYKASSPQ